MARKPSLQFHPLRLFENVDFDTQKKVTTVTIKTKFTPLHGGKRMYFYCHAKVDEDVIESMDAWAKWARIQKGMPEDFALEGWLAYMLDSSPQQPMRPMQTIPTEIVMSYLMDWKEVPYKEMCQRQPCHKGSFFHDHHQSLKWIPPTNTDT